MPKRVEVEISMLFNIHNTVKKKFVLIKSVMKYEALYARHQVSEPMQILAR